MPPAPAATCVKGIDPMLANAVLVKAKGCGAAGVAGGGGVPAGLSSITGAGPVSAVVLLLALASSFCVVLPVAGADAFVRVTGAVGLADEHPSALMSTEL